MEGGGRTGGEQLRTAPTSKPAEEVLGEKTDWTGSSMQTHTHTRTHTVEFSRIARKVVSNWPSIVMSSANFLFLLSFAFFLVVVHCCVVFLPGWV